MLTITIEVFSGANFNFRIFGTPQIKTQAYKFLDQELENDKISNKLESVLRAIDTNPKGYTHPQKFKHLEKDVWEIKIKSLRIACVWDPKADYLIGIYAFNKRSNKWPKQDLENMRTQKNKYYEMKPNARLQGGPRERLS